jgi:hypothetical protein
VNTTASRDLILPLLHEIQDTYSVEYITLLDPQFKVWFTVNSQIANTTLPAERYGERLDPGGIVTAASATANGIVGRTVWLNARLPYAELAKENPPLFRDRESRLDSAFKVSTAMYYVYVWSCQCGAVAACCYWVAGSVDCSRVLYCTCCGY